MNPMDLFAPGGAANGHQGAPEAPNLPQASPLLRNDVSNPVKFPQQHGEVANPIGFGGPESAPVLQTPALSAHQALQYPGRGGSIDFGAVGGSTAFGNLNDGLSLQGHGIGSTAGQNGKGQFSDIFQWGWECGSDVGSVPSIWSKASTAKSHQSSNFSGDGQRLIFIKPQEVRSEQGGTVIIGLKKEIPEQFWNHVENITWSNTSGGERRGRK